MGEADEKEKEVPVLESKELTTKLFYDKIEDQTIYIASALAKHRTTTETIYRKITEKTHDLSKMLTNAYENFSNMSSSSSSSSSSDDPILYLRAKKSSDKENIKLLNKIISQCKKIMEGKIPLSENAAEAALKRLHELKNPGSQFSEAELRQKHLDQYNSLQQELGLEEVNKISDKQDDLNGKQRKALDQLEADLKTTLKNNIDPTQVDKILDDYDQMRTDLLEQHAINKRNQMAALRDKLANRRNQKQRRLARQQRAECKELKINEK